MDWKDHESRMDPSDFWNDIIYDTAGALVGGLLTLWVTGYVWPRNQMRALVILAVAGIGVAYITELYAADYIR